MRALVVFGDGGSPAHPLAFLLRKGFKHCCVAVVDGDYWIVVDGERGIPTIHVIAPSSFDLAGHYRDCGLTVIETEQRAEPKLLPLALNNCAGLVKAVLCLKTWAVTPWQLYKFLVKP